MYTIRDMTDYECMHSGCCNVDDPDNVMCNTNAFGEPANLVCLDKSNLKNYMACFSENEVGINTSLNSDWPQEVCSVFGPADKCHVDYPVDACPPDVCKMEMCDNPQDSFVCYKADPITGNAVGPGKNWGCRKNKPQKASACRSLNNCYGRGTCVRSDEEGCTACSCDPGEGYVGYFCAECAGGYACEDPNQHRVDFCSQYRDKNSCASVSGCFWANEEKTCSNYCFPPNKCK